MNSFKELERIQERRYAAHTRRAHKKITGTVSLYRFISDIVELFLPKMIHATVNIAGGNIAGKPKAPQATKKKKPPRYPNQ